MPTTSIRPLASRSVCAILRLGRTVSGRVLAILLTLTAVTSVIGIGSPGPIGRLIVFGDSLSDVGNVDDLTFGFVPGAPYWQGRFSNGPVWVETLAEDVDVPAPTPSRNDGTNYAHGGARTGSGFTSIIIPNVGTQIGTYGGSGPAPLADDLFVIFAGANDFIDGRSDPATPVDHLTSHIVELASLGATRFLVASLPPLGRTPRFLGTADEALLDGLADGFNDLYAEELATLTTDLGVTIHRLDVHGLMEQFIADPGAFGFTDVSTPAYDEDTGAIAPDPDHYLFWDDIHPTTAAHTLLGARAAGRLTCPADIDGAGGVDVDDLVGVILRWGDVGFSAGDVDDSGVVDVDDLLEVILRWGSCP